MTYKKAEPQDRRRRHISSPDVVVVRAPNIELPSIVKMTEITFSETQLLAQHPFKHLHVTGEGREADRI